MNDALSRSIISLGAGAVVAAAAVRVATARRRRLDAAQVPAAEADAVARLRCEVDRVGEHDTQYHVHRLACCTCLSRRVAQSSLNKLVEDVLCASSASQDATACSQTARLGFEALTRSSDMTASVDPIFFMSDDVAGRMPDRMAEPSVTYVNHTGDTRLFADDDGGHRFLVLQCHGHVQVLQACKGEYGHTVGMGTLYTCSRSAEHGIGWGRWSTDPL